MWRVTARWLFNDSHQSQSIEDTTSTRGRLTRPRKQPQQKQTDELLASIHTCIVSLLM